MYNVQSCPSQGRHSAWGPFTTTHSDWEAGIPTFLALTLEKHSASLEPQFPY